MCVLLQIISTHTDKGNKQNDEKKKNNNQTIYITHEYHIKFILYTIECER